jgi:chloramphenicol-sensitive protein RarD
VVAYGLWGLFPLYFLLLDSVSPTEVVAHRVIWSLVFLSIILFVTKAWRGLFQAARSVRVVGLLAIAALFLSVNWGVYVWAVQNDFVVEASLGYFINPLVSVALGIIVLRERLRQLQWVAVALALVAVLVLSLTMGHPPWISLILAFSFGIYGLLKKLVNVGAVQSLTIETVALAPIALWIVFGAIRDGSAAISNGDLSIVALLVLLGPVTAIPLIAFGAAATRIPLSTLGLLQYMTPIFQFILGITVFHEVMNTGSWVGFMLVWLALILFTFDTLRHARRVAQQRESARAADAFEVVEPD